MKSVCSWIIFGWFIQETLHKYLINILAFFESIWIVNISQDTDCPSGIAVIVLAYLLCCNISITSKCSCHAYDLWDLRDLRVTVLNFGFWVMSEIVKLCLSYVFLMPRDYVLILNQVILDDVLSLSMDLFNELFEAWTIFFQCQCSMKAKWM